MTGRRRRENVRTGWWGGARCSMVSRRSAGLVNPRFENPWQQEPPRCRSQLLGSLTKAALDTGRRGGREDQRAQRVEGSGEGASRPGAVNTEVTVELPGGAAVVAIITKSSADTLKLQEGKEVFAVIKASDVMIAIE